MAESDDNRPSGALSSDEADRLSERIKPSWEAEPEPLTVPKVEAPRPPQVLKQTLVGIAAPTTSEKPPASAPGGSPPDDLDWELPTNPAPSPVAEPASEPPPKSNPSGIGQTYKPKDVDAPAIVLKEDVQRAEQQARAALEAEHRSRRAPTVLKFKTADVVARTGVAQNVVASDADPPPVPAKQLGLGKWIGLGAAALSVALIGIMVMLRSPEEAPEPPAAYDTEPTVAAPAPPPEQAPPPPPTVQSPPAEAIAVTPDPASPTPLEPEKSEEPRQRESPPAVAAKPKPPPPAPKPTPVAKSPKTSSAPVKPAAAKPAGTQKQGSPVIVRDSPF